MIEKEKGCSRMSREAEGRKAVLVFSVRCEVRSKQGAWRLDGEGLGASGAVDASRRLIDLERVGGSNGSNV